MKECLLCKTRYQKGSGVTFHKFPTDKRRLELWLKNIEKPSWRPKKYDYICSKHFSDDCFIKHNSCTTLKKCSIPTIFYSSAENVSSTHESMVLPTPSVSGTRMVTPALLLSTQMAIAVDVKITLNMDQNLSGRKRRSTSSSRKTRSKLESSPSTHEKMVAPTPSVSGTRMVTPTPSVSGTIGEEVKRRLIMEQNDTNLSCRKRRRTSCEPRQSTASKQFRSLSEVSDNIKHDHRYVITPKSSKKALQRVKNSLRKSRGRVKVLSQHVKRLNVNVSSLRTVISELKKKATVA